MFRAHARYTNSVFGRIARKREEEEAKVDVLKSKEATNKQLVAIYANESERGQVVLANGLAPRRKTDENSVG